MKISKPFSRLILPLSLLISLSEIRGQVGNNNPTGVAGWFNGSVTTGCSYDPFTASAARKIMDISIAGSVSQYGLSYSRTWNTRSPGGWQNPYDWGIEAEGVPGQPQTYFVNFPDGRSEVFTYTPSDVDYRAAPGVRERLAPWTATNGDTGVCYLVLPDGGKVEFSGTRRLMYDPDPPYWWYEYELAATAIIDPHGRRTTFSYNEDGSFQITEPAGRWIKVYYTTAGLVDYIKASDLREVHYTYQTQTFPPGAMAYPVLTNVAYYGDASLNATYTYRGPNVDDPNGPPLLATCDDPMYPGPMKQITYAYRTKANPDGTAAVYGQISTEKKTGATGPAVSTLDITGTDTRRETRADGRQRTFTYSDNGYLIGWTDFRNVSSSQTYDSAMYVASVTDGRDNTTNFTNNRLTYRSPFPGQGQGAPPLIAGPGGTVDAYNAWLMAHRGR